MRGEESIILRHPQTGLTVRTPAYPDMDYIRIVGASGTEIVYWSIDEWQDDTDGTCMGAIMGAIKQVAEGSSLRREAVVVDV